MPSLSLQEARSVVATRASFAPAEAPRALVTTSTASSATARPSTVAPLSRSRRWQTQRPSHQQPCTPARWRESGQVACWGRNNAGQLGDGSETDASTPVMVPGLVDAVQVATGGATSCAIRSGGAVVCWGLNEGGQLGDGSTANSARPVTVSGIADAIQVRLGGLSTCALRSTGRVMCWGYNYRGQLGDGTTTDRTEPVEVVDL
ncbi:MAG: hypothetical protein M5U28_45620 [Sandaracinaceae bacterium]|nr:hypothetical protein [Sandaracinaceae bacterium]